MNTGLRFMAAMAAVSMVNDLMKASARAFRSANIAPG